MFTCDEIKHIPESASINPSSGINYWINCVFNIAGDYHC